ncbi:acyl-CoA dehydrogenase family protein, partial [Acinetobacter baumannii]|uniref:acyl-CoA dehydrogenase family protein n=1 Tax=Acinetobacter baumannii TaxID=470 RepID=UPI00112FF76F
MKFTAEHEALRRTARQFVENELNPNIPEWEEAGRFPIHDVFKKMGEKKKVKCKACKGFGFIR